METKETVNQETGTEKTFTQKELDQIVSDRLKREKEKYADYAALKEKADAYDKHQEESKSELQKATDRADKLQKELDDIKQTNATRDIRAKVAKEMDIPVDLLTGSTEEDCKAQAEAIKAYANPQYPQIKDGGEAGGAPAASTSQQFAVWANQIF